MDLAQHLAEVLAADEIEELKGGYQSRVFRLTNRHGVSAVAKVLDVTMVDRHELEARLDVTAALADLDPRVCRPLLLAHDRITEIALADGQLRYVVCFEFADGVALDPGKSTDAERMGMTLSHLHASMRQLPPMPLPLVAALRPMLVEVSAASAAHQLLHGDFNTGNLRVVDGVVRVFDLDDCGYGPAAFDVASALYMVLFDAVVHGSLATYEVFRRSFVSGYVGVSSQPLADETLDRLINVRVEALRTWLDDLDNAPIGIRTASHDWQNTLRSFVDTHRPPIY